MIELEKNEEVIMIQMKRNYFVIGLSYRRSTGVGLIIREAEGGLGGVIRL